MSQWMADTFVPPVSGYDRPTARCTVPPIFSSTMIEPIGAVDARVGADPELAEHARAVVGVEHRLQHFVAALGASAHHAALAEPERDPGDLAAARQTTGCRSGLSLSRVLDRAGEDFARRHVALAVGVDPRTARRPDKRQVGPRSLDPDLARAVDSRSIHRLL